MPTYNNTRLPRNLLNHQNVNPHPPCTYTYTHSTQPTKSRGKRFPPAYPLTHNAGSHKEWQREKPQFAFSLIHQI